MLIDKARIAALIPHAGVMSLLDSVDHWNAGSILCAATSHRYPDNPLRRAGRLGVLCGVEYAAQAMALHGALTAGDAPALAGYLASLREVSCHIDRLDLLPHTLFVEATRLMGDSRRAIYHFKLRHDDRVLLQGRAAVALTGAAVPSAGDAWGGGGLPNG